MPATNGTRRPSFQMSIDSRTVYERLIQTAIGETVTYDELTALIGRDIRSPRAMGRLTTARRAVLHENNIVFGVIQKIGLKRLDDIEIVATGQQSVNRIKNLARRCVERLTIGVREFDKLPNEAKVRHNTYVSMVGAVHMMTKPANIKLLEAKISQSKAVLPLAHTLEVFCEKQTK